MNFWSLVRRNVLYQWRGNLAVTLGIALGAAVLTGALLVGDSLRGSLRDLSLEQLGWVDGVLAPGRLFTQSLAKAFPAERSAPVVLLNASASPEEKPERVASMQLFGVTPAFWKQSPIKDAFADEEGSIFLNEPLARDLDVKVGDRLSLNVQKSDNIPRETLLGKRKSDDSLESFTVTVKGILPDAGMARFSLRPSPEPIRNAFVPLTFLQKRLNLGDRINIILTEGDVQSVDLRTHLTLRDWGLKLLTPDDRARALVRFLDPNNRTGDLRKPKWQGRIPDELANRANADGVLTQKAIDSFYQQQRRYLLLQSDNLSLDPPTEKALSTAFWLKNPEYRPMLIYLADRIAVGGADEPYSTVAAVLPDQVPMSDVPLKDGEIRLAQWPGSPLSPKLGENVEIEYYFPDAGNTLVLKKANFRYAGAVPLTGSADDPDWTPEYPGLTDKLDIASWENPPFPPYSTRKVMERIKPADEDFWKRYRASPKAYITLADGQKLFATRFGRLTALRVDLPNSQDPQVAAAEFARRLLEHLNPAEGGFAIQNVREQALAASSGATDFGGLFLGFSFFLILSALLLVGLLVRLNLERRGSEIGLLSATGWTPSLIGRLLRGEGWILIVIGAIVGLLAARWFAGAMLKLLAVKWPGQGSLQFLKLHETPLSYAIGFAASALVSAGTLWLAFRMLRKLTPRQLLSGDLAPLSASAANPRSIWARVSTWVLVVSILSAIGSLASTRTATDHEALAGGFFGAGFLALSAFLTLAWMWLHARGQGSDPQPTLVRLGVRNAGRNPVRSLLTIGLLAAAAFMVVAVQAFHHEPAVDFFQNHGGSGGFNLYAQTEVPLFQNLGDAKVQDELGIKPEITAKIEELESFRVQPGDDASCLNLYKPLRPKVLGVPPSLIAKNRFAFASSVAKAGTPEAANPWLLLNQPQDDESFPAIVDANSAQWILKVSLGGQLIVKNAAGEDVKLRIVGLLKESMFQSEVLVSEASFLRIFPTQQGYQFFLVRCPTSDQAAVQSALAAALATQGGQVQPTFSRLESYLAVENTYLATFQALGGLGLLLGAVGLAIVLVRGVWERRAEFALLRAVGFQRRQLALMVMAENVTLLLMGLAIGCAAAVVAIAPHLLGGDARLVWEQIALLLAGVTTVGLVAASLAVAGSLRTPVLTALRRE